MKANFLTALFIVTALFFGCKNEKSVDDLNVKKEEAIESKVKVVLDVVAPKDDVFQLYYTEDGTLNFDDQKSVKVSLKGNPASQKVVFELPEDIAITFIRLDFGENKDQGVLTIKNFVMEYFGKKWEAKGNKFFQFFGPNEQMKLDYNNSTLTPVIKEGVKYDPIVYPMEQAGVEIDKLVKGK